MKQSINGRLERLERQRPARFTVLYADTPDFERLHREALERGDLIFVVVFDDKGETDESQ